MGRSPCIHATSLQCHSMNKVRRKKIQFLTKDTNILFNLLTLIALSHSTRWNLCVNKPMKFWPLMLSISSTELFSFFCFCFLFFFFCDLLHSSYLYINHVMSILHTHFILPLPWTRFDAKILKILIAWKAYNVLSGFIFLDPWRIIKQDFEYAFEVSC